MKGLVLRILSPLRSLHLDERLIEDIDDSRGEQWWLVFSIKCSGQLPLELVRGMDLSASGALDGEAGVAQGFLMEHFSVLRELMRRSRVNPVELEELVHALPDLVPLAAANASTRDRRIAYGFPQEELRDLTLSPLPGRAILKDHIDVSFRIRSVGCEDAQVQLSKSSRMAARRLRNGVTKLSWTAKDSAVSEQLFAAMQAGETMVATVKNVLNCQKNAGAELLLVSLGRGGP